MRRVFLSVVFIYVCGVLPLSGHHVKLGASKTMPVTTSSVKARDLYERAMQDYENLYLERCNVGWRAAVIEDPNFASAYAWIAFNSRNPAEAKSAREKAKALAPHVSRGEQLMIMWIADVQENKMIEGISAMNDMFEVYPKDKRLLYLAANWMMGAHLPEQAERLLKRALEVDKNYPPALNDLAYAYARTRQFDQAFATMERYIAVLPNEPNPQDSYAEILRMSGNFPAALEHYRAALKIDPDFVSSQLGLADTYALMGDEAQARIEYDKAIGTAHTDADRLDYGLQKAMTWAREGNLAEADKAFESVAWQAHAQRFALEAAQAHRMISLYQTDDDRALKHLAAAELELDQPCALAEVDRQEEHARILRYTASRAAHAGNDGLADSTLQELESLANTNSRDVDVQQSYHGAAGALLMTKGKFAAAIPHLEEDNDNPYSMELLARAYSQTESFDKVHDAEGRLRGTNVPTIEQALVVPNARSKKPIFP
jgi:tetratricopeptide (TPR) repeat protein